MDDAHFYRADNIEKAGADIPPGYVSILLSHTPEIYRQAAHAGFDLTPADIPTAGRSACLAAFLSCSKPTCRARSPLARGDTPTAGYTSVGAGSSVVPVRFNNRPEITLHQLVRGAL